MNKQQAKEKIKKLVERYERLSEAEKKRYNEQQTKDHFIRPLFEALGWNFEEDVWPETDVSGKRVDFVFKADGITKFFIEAKKIAVNLDEERWAEQAINYSWHKSVPWVILTDFEAIKVFNTEWDEANVQSCRFIEIPYTEYLTSEKLWWLSPDAFRKGVLDKEADKVGRRPKKIIDEQLAGDLIRWRDLLRKDLEGYNPKADKQKIAEYVQKILDRLIFIRTLEDRKIEDVILQLLVRRWKEKKGVKANQLLTDLNKTFRKIDGTYNSGLFEKGACDFLGEKIEADDNTFIEIINELYKTKDKGIRYNFADIPADIFGGIYEQYLGYIQKEDLKEKKTSKRKSQGIYYTPRYIVDYIVQNTLGEILKDKTPDEIRNLKILDSACGSGSFLITAYRSLIDYWQKREGKRFKQKSGKLKKIEQTLKKQNGNLISSPEKMRILRDNIFGVDLDKEAVELAKLNLLMKMVGSQIKLPKLDNNIQEGNSLISGSEKELKKYFGRGWKNKKAFEWEGKFDVVIGNPPYERIMSLEKDKEYFSNNYQSAYGSYDIYVLFIERAINLLKENGILGFITSNKYFISDYGKNLRKFLMENGEIVKIVDLSDTKKIFKDALVSTAIIIFRKRSNPRKNYKLQRLLVSDKNLDLLKGNVSNYYVNIKDITNQSNYAFNVRFNKDTDNIEQKILSKSTTFEKLFKIRTGIMGFDYWKLDDFIKDDSNKKGFVRIATNSYIKPYAFLWGKKINLYKKNFCNPYLKLDNPILNQNTKELFTKRNKIIIRGVAKRLTAMLDKEGVGLLVAVHCICNDSQYDNKFILALLNSKFYNWLHVQRYYSARIPEGSLKYPISFIKKLPIYKIDFSDKKEKAKHDRLVKLADEMLKLNKELQKLDPILDDEEYKEIKEKIDKTDGEIDERVFELYGLGEGEVGIVESCDKK